MKKLEEIIRNNPDAFNSEEPSSNHFGKFLEKLDAKQIHRRREIWIRRLTHVAAAAAVILLVVSITLLRKTSHTDAGISYNTSTEVKEIEVFYQNQIERSLQALNTTLKQCPAQKKNLSSCLKELNKSFESIQNDLKENPGDERIINALVNNYRTKLEVLDQIQKQTDKNCI